MTTGETEGNKVNLVELLLLSQVKKQQVGQMFENNDEEEGEGHHGDNNTCFRRANCMLEAINAITSLCYRFYYYHHFTKEKTEKQRV